jgi:tetratricopeptide (TPR) repeat protein
MNAQNQLSDLMVEAYKHQKNGDLSLAIQAWNGLINHQAADENLRANGHLSLGNLHQLQGNDELAIESMTSAIKANPNSAEAYFCLAYLAQQQENFAAAIDYFKNAINLNSTDSGAFNNLGNCYDKLGKSSEAIKAYSRAISLDEHYIAAIYNRGNAYFKLAEDELALKDLNKTLELDANFYQAHYNQSILLRRMGKLAQAKRAATLAKTLAQQDLEHKTPE